MYNGARRLAHVCLPFSRLRMHPKCISGPGFSPNPTQFSALPQTPSWWEGTVSFLPKNLFFLTVFYGIEFRLFGSQD